MPTQSVIPSKPTKWLTDIVLFIEQTFESQGKSQAVIAVSGGIDSAVSASLLVQALGAKAVTGLMLPFKDQSTVDARTILKYLGVPVSQQIVVPITPMVKATAEIVGLPATSVSTDKLTRVRLGNIMARARMMVVYDYARQLNALVCGTENRSEHHLGYFTRFGDAASDLEPIAGLYKTQVRQLAELLDIPPVFLSKSPTAGLWAGQTDERELGFSYEEADQVLHCLIDEKMPLAKIAKVTGLDETLVAKVANQVAASTFKLQVPYQLP